MQYNNERVVDTAGHIAQWNRKYQYGCQSVDTWENVFWLIVLFQIIVADDEMIDYKNGYFNVEYIYF